jgi:hypothetical protein
LRHVLWPRLRKAFLFSGLLPAVLGGYGMWETIQALIKGLPEWYIMVLVPVLLIIALYFLPRIRRDKQGRVYIQPGINQCFFNDGQSLTLFA